jgi:hypothetical protein
VETAAPSSSSSPSASPTIHFKNSLDIIFKSLSSQHSKSPTEKMLFELGNIRNTISRELEIYFNNPVVEEDVKRKRLTYLFVKDLLDGVNGMILDQKDQRDHYDAMIPSVSFSSKVLAGATLFISSMGMLYYVFLFAMNQSTHRQTAWFSSFQIWLFFEIFIVSTGLVFVEHILIPLWCLKDLQRVKEKIVTDILLFQKKIKSSTASSTSASASVMTNTIGGSRGAVRSGASAGGEDSVRFNAAEYLYPSHRIASLFSQFQESKVILQYQTIWPKRSFQIGGAGGSGGSGGGAGIKKKYDKRFEFLTKTLTRVAIFSITSVIHLPPSFQDLGIQIFLFTSFGFLVKFHLQLFEIHPVLVLFPTLCVGIVLYVMLSVGKKPRLLSETYPLASLKEEEQQPQQQQGQGKQGEEQQEHGEEGQEEEVKINEITTPWSTSPPPSPQPPHQQQDSSEEDSSLSSPRPSSHVLNAAHSCWTQRGDQSRHDLMLAEEFFSKLDSQKFRGDWDSCSWGDSSDEEISSNSFQLPTNASTSSSSSGAVLHWESSSESSHRFHEESSSRSLDRISWESVAHEEEELMSVFSVRLHEVISAPSVSQEEL